MLSQHPVAALKDISLFGFAIIFLYFFWQVCQALFVLQQYAFVLL